VFTSGSKTSLPSFRSTVALSTHWTKVQSSPLPGKSGVNHVDYRVERQTTRQYSEYREGRTVGDDLLITYKNGDHIKVHGPGTANDTNLLDEVKEREKLSYSVFRTAKSK
jgi:hypothetical protein